MEQIFKDYQFDKVPTGYPPVLGQPRLSHEQELCSNNFITHKCLQFPYKKNEKQAKLPHLTQPAVVRTI